MITFQRIRGVLFYLSLLLFFIGLPLILFYALGYKFNLHNFKLIKTGLIYVKTQPEGARVYINHKLMPEKTPASIQELIPGVYKVTLELDKYYSWKGEVDVEAGKVSRLDKIILFSITPNLLQLNQEEFSSFRIDTEKKLAYYLDQNKRIIYRSDLAAGNFEDIANLPEDLLQISAWEVSPDGKKVAIFNNHQLNILFFDTQNDYEYLNSPIFLDYSREKIINVFWHSDSYHLIVLTNRYVQIIEASPSTKPINLVELNNENVSAFYDHQENILYFKDSRKKSVAKVSNNLYKLELNSVPYLLEKLMQGVNE